MALTTPEPGSGCTYSELLRTIDGLGDQIRSLGIGKNDRICTIFPNGMQAAIAFLAVSSVAQCIPLNPASGHKEITRQLGMCDPALLILGISLYERPENKGQDSFDVRIVTMVDDQLQTESGDRIARAAVEGATPPGPDDVAVIVQTSGSTGIPKLVPLKHRQMLMNAANFADALALTTEDRCLNIMQMHHVGGLQGTMLATLSSGGTSICARGFSAADFWTWLESSRATWFEAVPTMLTTLMANVQKQQDPITSSTLRMVRSSSSALSPALLFDVERIFGVPVIEAYGMSEAGLMAINPLDAEQRKPGSVGKVVSNSVEIAGPNGDSLPIGQVGEIVASGEFVIEAYAEGGDPSRESFVDGKFRTGDLGRMDADGYLTLVGRSKEMVNRGGENIGLREIDEALELHPTIVMAVAFGVPHPILGEELLAAVVLADGEECTSALLRRHLAQSVSWSRVPKQVFFLDELPKGSTGKILRNVLAAEHADHFNPANRE